MMKGNIFSLFILCGERGSSNLVWLMGEGRGKYYILPDGQGQGVPPYFLMWYLILPDRGYHILLPDGGTHIWLMGGTPSG